MPDITIEPWPEVDWESLDDPELPCAFCERQGYVRIYTDQGGTVWTLCQDAETADPEDCHWTDRGIDPTMPGAKAILEEARARWK